MCKHLQCYSGEYNTFQRKETPHPQISHHYCALIVAMFLNIAVSLYAYVLNCMCLCVCVCECVFAGKRGPYSDILHSDSGRATKRGRPRIGEIVLMGANSTCIHMRMC